MVRCSNCSFLERHQDTHSETYFGDGTGGAHFACRADVEDDLDANKIQMERNCPSFKSKDLLSGKVDFSMSGDSGLEVPYMFDDSDHDDLEIISTEDNSD